MKAIFINTSIFLLCFFSGANLNAQSTDIYHTNWIDFNKNGSKDIYEDPDQGIDKRVDDLLSQMNLNEKSCQLATLYGFGAVLKDQLPTPEWKQEIWKDGIANIDEQLTGLRHQDDLSNVYPHAKHVESLNQIQRFFIEDTRLGVPVDFTCEGIRGLNHYKATFFPAQIGLGSTWDKRLIRKIGEVTGKEAYILGYTNIYSPILDLARDPRWGRTVETYGEDPYLVAQLGKQQIQGLQAQGMMSTAKHFCVYGIPIGGRDGACRTHPQVGERDLFSLHLEPFRVAIHEAGAMGVMASYNDYNGIPIAENKFLLTDVLRKTWGMKGYVVSDSDALEYLFTKHKTSASYIEGIGKWLAAGGNVRTNFTSPEEFILPLREGIETGIIPIEIVNERVREVLKTKFLMGLFDHPYRENPKLANQLVACNDHKDLAKEAALKSIVLLKNDSIGTGTFLPLKKGLQKIGVFGPLADEKKAIHSRYGPVGSNVVSVLEGIKRVSGADKILHIKGAEVRDNNFPQSDILKSPPKGESEKMIQDALLKAKECDVLIVCLGDDHKTVGESMSRYSLDFPGYQQELLEALAKIGKPIILVMLNGRPVSCNWADRHVSAIIEAWYLGEFTGDAVAEVIFGDYNPAGSLPITFPKSTGQIPLAFPFHPGGDDFGYARVDGPLYAFGHGLSYTTFDYHDLRIKVIDNDILSPKVEVSCTIKNSGSLDGDEVVQLYLNDEVSSVITYKKVLRGFERVHVKSGESKEVKFQLGLRKLGLYNQKMNFVCEHGTFKIWVSSASDDDRLEGSFEL
jgi:beta-glucosidase